MTSASEVSGGGIVRCLCTDTTSHCHGAPETILESNTQEKKRINTKAVEDRQGTFTPFVLSVDGLLPKEAEHFLKHMAQNCPIEVGQSLF